MAKYRFTQVIQGKGWTLKSLAERWGFKHAQSVGRIAARPSKRDMDAAEGLPRRIVIEEDER